MALSHQPATDHRSKARINSAALAAAKLYDETDVAFAKRLEISNSYLNILFGKDKRKGKNPIVLHRTIWKLSKILNLDVWSLVYQEATAALGVLALPEDEAYYERLRYGFYIANAHGPHGNDGWQTQDVKLEHEATRRKQAEILTFRGTATNCVGMTFTLQAERINPHVFVVRATNRDLSQCWFGVSHGVVQHHSAGATTPVLCGLWTGWRRIGDLAVYGWLLSEQPLIREEINVVSKLYKTHYCMRSDLFSEGIGQIRRADAAS